MKSGLMSSYQNSTKSPVVSLNGSGGYTAHIDRLYNICDIIKTKVRIKAPLGLKN